MRDRGEVCSLSRGMMSPAAQSLSAPLQRSLRLLPLPLPAAASRTPCGASTPRGRHRAYHVSCTCPHGLGPTYPPVVQRLRQTRWQRLYLTTHLLVQACQHLSLVNFHDVYRWFTSVDHTAPSWLPTPLVLVVTASAHASAAILVDEATLSQELRTPPLPATHVLVGYRWQNNGWRPSSEVATATYTTSCRA